MIGKKRPSYIGKNITIAKLAGSEPSEGKRIRKLAKFARARTRMLERDGFTCQICYESGLDAHHIHPIRTHPEKAYDIDNLITLCKKCHDKKVSRNESDWVDYFESILKSR